MRLANIHEQKSSGSGSGKANRSAKPRNAEAARRLFGRGPEALQGGEEWDAFEVSDGLAGHTEDAPARLVAAAILGRELTDPGRILSVGDEEFTRRMAKADRCPGGLADACLWMAEGGGVFPVFMLPQAHAIADHLQAWSENHAGDFALCFLQRQAATWPPCFPTWYAPWSGSRPPTSPATASRLARRATICYGGSSPSCPASVTPSRRSRR